MKKRGETLILAVILIGALFIGGWLAPIIFNQERKARLPGDPVDVTQLVKKEFLLDIRSAERGSRAPIYNLVEFADFECPSCRSAQEVVDEIVNRHKDLRLIFRHLPLKEKHPHSEIAARAAEAARLQDKFWEMHKILFARQTEWSVEEDPQQTFIGYAVELGLDKKRFFEDMKSNEEITTRLIRDKEIASASSVRVSPSFFLITPTKIWAVIGPEGLRRLRDQEMYWK
jgi:protein-disulfide isomerase